MGRFIRRFIGALALDAATFEDVESDRLAGIQAGVVVLLACVAGGFAAMNLNSVGALGFAMGTAATFAAWIVWAMLISAIGTTWMREAQTQSNPGELLRTVGFAAAPGVFYSFAAMQAVTPFVFVVVSIWMIAAAVLAVRQALDYRSTVRAVAVCIIGWLVSFGLTAAIAMLFTRTVN